MKLTTFTLEFALQGEHQPDDIIDHFESAINDFQCNLGSTVTFDWAESTGTFRVIETKDAP